MGKGGCNMMDMCYILSGAVESWHMFQFGTVRGRGVGLACVCVVTAGTWPHALCVLEDT